MSKDQEKNIKHTIAVPVAYRGGSGTVFSIVASPEAGSSPTSEIYSDSDVAKDYQSWEDDNLWPVKTRVKLQSSTTAYPLIAKSACLMYGKGPLYYREVRNGADVTIDWTRIPEVDEFIQNNNIDYLMLERLMDYKTYGNVFCEFILNKAVNKIVNVYHKEAEFTRFGTIKDNKVLDVKYVSNWEKSASDAIPIPFLMKRDQNTDYILKTFKSQKKFVTHSCLPSPGSTLYAKPPHIGLVKQNGWLDYANGIPELMNAINENGMMLRYHIEIPDSYWASIDPEWPNKSAAEQAKVIDAKFDQMDTFLKGKKNAASSFYSHFATDPMTGKQLPGWSIKPIEDPIKKDQFLTSVQEADIQITRAIGMDVSLAGIQPAGGKMGAGSGSDKRTAYTNSVSMSHAEAMIILEPLKLVQQVNGWDPALRFAFEYDIPTTLNEDKSGVKNSLDA
jgi:hypothetical protein